MRSPREHQGVNTEGKRETGEHAVPRALRPTTGQEESQQRKEPEDAAGMAGRKPEEYLLGAKKRRCFNKEVGCYQLYQKLLKG